MDSNLPNHYAILEVGFDATQAEIRTAYKRLVLSTHPDKTGDESTATQFRAVQEAYETLKDVKKKANYDLGWRRNYAAPPPRAPPPRAPPSTSQSSSFGTPQPPRPSHFYAPPFRQQSERPSTRLNDFRVLMWAQRMRAVQIGARNAFEQQSQMAVALLSPLVEQYKRGARIQRNGETIINAMNRIYKDNEDAMNKQRATDIQAIIAVLGELRLLEQSPNPPGYFHALSVDISILSWYTVLHLDNVRPFALSLGGFDINNVCFTLFEHMLDEVVGGQVWEEVIGCDRCGKAGVVQSATCEKCGQHLCVRCVDEVELLQAVVAWLRGPDYTELRYLFKGKTNALWSD